MYHTYQTCGLYKLQYIDISRAQSMNNIVQFKQNTLALLKSINLLIA